MKAIEDLGDHFHRLAESNLGSNLDWEKIKAMVEDFYGNEELLLDVPFTAEKVANAVRRLKKRKVPGLEPDDLLAEHLKAGGKAVIIWLRNILNTIMQLEAIPEVLKRSVIVPVYRVGGKDPLCIDSYRGITLTSMVANFCYWIGLSQS